MSNVLRHPRAGTEPVHNPRRRGRLPKNVTRLPLTAPTTPEPQQTAPRTIPHGIVIVHDDSRPDVMVFNARQALELSMNLMRAQVQCWAYMRDQFPELFDDGDAR